jgi:hypothetical protein
MASITNIISSLNSITEKSSFNVYIPSLKREVKFKPLSTKQQQSFYSCVVDIVPFYTRFIIATFNIISENCTEPAIIPQLNIFDRLVILLALRKNTLGSSIAIIKDKVQYVSDFDICFENAKTLDVPDSKSVDLGNIIVELQVPRVVDQYVLEKTLRENVDTSKMNPDTIISQSVLGETSKLIKSVKLVQESETIDVNYEQLNVKDRFTVLENLPAEIMIEVQQYAKLVSQTTDKLLTVNITEDKTAIFDITVDFFLSK